MLNLNTFLFNICTGVFRSQGRRRLCGSDAQGSEGLAERGCDQGSRILLV